MGRAGQRVVAGYAEYRPRPDGPAGPAGKIAAGGAICAAVAVFVLVGTGLLGSPGPSVPAAARPVDSSGPEAWESGTPAHRPAAAREAAPEASAPDPPLVPVEEATGACTREVSNPADLRAAILAGNPEEVVCLRGTAARPAADVALAFAREQLGTPYVWGGNGPDDGGFDCSGLVMKAYASAGVRLPRTAQAQFEAGPRVSEEEPIRAGDLVFFGGGPKSVTHVGVAISATRMIDAPQRGEVVKVGPIKRNNLVGITRPAGRARSGQADG